MKKSPANIVRLVSVAGLADLVTRVGDTDHRAERHAAKVFQRRKVRQHYDVAAVGNDGVLFSEWSRLRAAAESLNLVSGFRRAP